MENEMEPLEARVLLMRAGFVAEAASADDDAVVAMAGRVEYAAVELAVRQLQDVLIDAFGPTLMKVATFLMNRIHNVEAMRDRLFRSRNIN